MCLSLRPSISIGSVRIRLIAALTATVVNERCSLAPEHEEEPDRLQGSSNLGSRITIRCAHASCTTRVR